MAQAYARKRRPGRTVLSRPKQQSLKHPELHVNSGQKAKSRGGVGGEGGERSSCKVRRLHQRAREPVQERRLKGKNRATKPWRRAFTTPPLFVGNDERASEIMGKTFKSSPIGYVSVRFIAGETGDLK